MQFKYLPASHEQAFCEPTTKQSANPRRFSFQSHLYHPPANHILQAYKRSKSNPQIAEGEKRMTYTLGCGFVMITVPAFESILASNLDCLIRFTIHRSASSGLRLSFSERILRPPQEQARENPQSKVASTCMRVRCNILVSSKMVDASQVREPLAGWIESGAEKQGTHLGLKLARHTRSPSTHHHKHPALKAHSPPFLQQK